MVTWKKQGAAVVGAFSLADGREGKVVLVAGRDNPRGAMVVSSGGGGEAVEPIPLSECLESMEPASLIEVLCMQERAFGNSGLEAPDLS